MIPRQSSQMPPPVQAPVIPSSVRPPQSSIRQLPPNSNTQYAPPRAPSTSKPVQTAPKLQHPPNPQNSNPKSPPWIRKLRIFLTSAWDCKNYFISSSLDTDFFLYLLSYFDLMRFSDHIFYHMQNVVIKVTYINTSTNQK